MHWQLETLFKHFTCSAPPCIFFFLFGGGETKVVNCLCCQSVKQFSLYKPCLNKTTKLNAMAFPCYFKVFAQYCIKIPYTSGKSHCIKFHGLLDKFLFTMSLWKKASAAVGLSVLTPREVARGALTCPEFQKMPDPLNRDPVGPVVVKAEVRNTVLYCNFEFKMSNMSTPYITYISLVLGIQYGGRYK